MTSSIKKSNFLPDSHCVICGKTLDEVGGRRIVAQHLRGITFSNKHLGGGNPEYPHKSFIINPEQSEESQMPRYLVVWGEPSMWNEETIQRALDAVSRHKTPWFCQVCGKRTCPECGYPGAYPAGSDVLYDNGCSAHVAILPVNLRCINQNCPRNLTP